MSLGEAVVDIVANTSKFTSKTKQDVDAALDSAASKMKSTGKTMAGVGAGLTAGITAPLVGIGISSVKTAAEFETSMNVLQSATGSSGKEMDSLSGLAKKLGADTVFSANEAADAMLELGKSGQSTSEIMKTVPQVMNLAATEGLELGNAAGIVTSALSQFSLEAKDSGDVVNALAGASNASKGSVAELSESLKLVGSAASGIGMSVQDTSAALAALADNGLEGSVAGTSLAAVFNRLVPQTDAARTAMKNLGLDFTKADGSFKSIYEISGDLRGAFKNMDQESRKIALSKIFGGDASTMAAVNALINTGAEDWKKYGKAVNDSTAASDMADARMKGTQGALEKLSGAWDTMKLTIGEAMAPLVVFASEGLGKVLDGFQKLPKGAQTFIVALAGVAAIIGPLLVVVGGLIASIGAIAGAFAAVSLPVIAIVAGIGVLIGAFVLFMAKSSEARAVVVGVFQQIAAIVKPALGEIASIVKTQIMPAMQSAWPVIEKVGVFLLKAFGAMTLTSIRTFVGVLVGVFRIIGGLFKTISAVIKGDWKGAWDGIKQILSGNVKIIQSLTRTMWTVIKSVFKVGIAITKALWRAAWNAQLAIVKGVGRAIQVTISSVMRAVGSAVRGGISSVRAAFSSGFAAARSVVTGAMASIRSAVSSGIRSVVGTVRGLPGQIRGALGGLGSMLWSSGYSMISGLADGIRAGIGNAVGAAQDAVGAVRNLFPFSPAKEGPFSGSGYTTHSGEALMGDFAKSMVKAAAANLPKVTAAMNPFANAVPVTPAATSTAAPAAPQAPSAPGMTQADLVNALAMLLASLTLNVTLGSDRRTKAEWYLDGKKYAETLA